MTSSADEFAVRGFGLFERATPPDDLAYLDGVFPTFGRRVAGGREDAFSQPAQDWLTGHSGLTGLAAQLLRAPARLSRIQAFDKSPEANWFVPWHQDRAEGGTERPVAALEQTVALRIHLDDCGDMNGPLEVIPGSHLCGRLTSTDISRLVAGQESRPCLARRGDILALRPLLIHRSKRAHEPAARRVVHLEYRAIAV